MHASHPIARESLTMFPNSSSLTPLPARPDNLEATGKISQAGPWAVTEFRDDEGSYYYKYQRGSGKRFEALWYVNPVVKKSV